MFERTLRIIDKKIMEDIQCKKILLVGIGGVGGFVLEGLIRSGFQNITIIDYDIIEKSNLNRQIITNINNVGNSKIEEAKARVLSINPQVKLEAITMFLDENNINKVINNQYDYIIDACDTITTKYFLIKECLKKKIKIVSCMGTGNRLNPQQLEITSLDKTYNDPLAKNMRSILKKNNITLKIPVIWSRELPLKTNNGLGSMIMVPCTAGMLITYYILEDIKKATI